MTEWSRWLTYVQQSVEGIGRQIPPGGGWSPTLLLAGPRGLGITPLPPHLQEDAAFPQLTKLISSYGADVAARVQMAWAVDGTAALDVLAGQGPRPEEHPRRREVLVVAVARAGYHEVWTAEVERVDGRPVLTAWAVVVNGPSRYAQHLADSLS